MKTETLQFNTANGASTAYVATPDETNGKAVILIHEWWGLNDHIKDIANRYAEAGFTALAPDLYRGKVTRDKEEAGRLMQNLDLEDGLNTIQMAIDKARETYGTGKFGITGFCMGGTFALRAACELENIGAAAPFYGDIPDEFTLKDLKCPVIFNLLR
jgi:carboxymethylenebutenolidase